MLAFDSLHQPIWELQFPRIVNGPRTEIYYVNRAANGDLIWVGALSDHIETDLVPSIGRISPNGEMKWVRYYYHLDRPWDFLQQLYYITETSDGGLIATGLRYDIDINNPNPNYKEANIWLLKLDGEGCMTPGCTDETIYFQSDTAIVASNEIVKTNQTIFKIYPNPTSAETQIYFLSAASTKNKTLKIFSINGHLMQQEELDGSNQTVKVDLVGFPSGIYVVALEQDGQVLQRERLIKR